MKQAALLRFFSFLLIMATCCGCSQQPQQVINSPCSTLNATVQIKPSINLSLLFGTDAIQAAMDTIKKQATKQGSASADEITRLGTDAAVRTAQASGKNVKPEDRAVMDAYLRDEVVPAIKQNPTCIFNVASPARPYVGIEKLFLRANGTTKSPVVGIVNTGLAEANAHIALHLILDGKEHLNNSTDIILGPNHRRTISLREANLPTPDIDSGKTVLTIVVDISYPLESGATPVLHREAWRYDHVANEFYSSPLK